MIGLKREPSYNSGYSPDHKGPAISNESITISNVTLTPIKLFSNIPRHSFNSPVPHRRNIYIPPSPPRKNARSRARILNTKDSYLNDLKELITDLIHHIGIKPFNNTNAKNSLTRLLNNYERFNTANQETEYDRILKHGSNLNLSTLNLSTLNINNERYIASGKNGNVYRLNGKNAVLKILKTNPKNNNKQSLLGEFYSALINYKIQLELREKRISNDCINKILQIYVKRQRNSAGVKIAPNTLVLSYQEANGDLITFLEKELNFLTNINLRYEAFHKLFQDSIKILYLLIILGYVHRDIKPDNMLYIKTPDGKYYLQITDLATIRKVNTSTTVIVGSKDYISPNYVLQYALLSPTNKIKIKHLLDFYSMGISDFIFCVNILNIESPYVNYFPFTEEYTENLNDLKYNIWRNNRLYQEQVILLQDFIDYCLRNSINKGLSSKNRGLLEKDLQMIQTLVLSNNPFPNRGQDMEAETIQAIKTYLGIR